MKITIEITDLCEEDFTNDSDEDVINQVYDDPYIFLITRNGR